MRYGTLLIISAAAVGLLLSWWILSQPMAPIPAPDVVEPAYEGPVEVASIDWPPFDALYTGAQWEDIALRSCADPEADFLSTQLKAQLSDGSAFIELTKWRCAELRDATRIVARVHYQDWMPWFIDNIHPVYPIH